jgi:hypothetical protein
LLVFITPCRNGSGHASQGSLAIAPVTQLVECDTCNIEVAGSNPVGGSKRGKIEYERTALSRGARRHRL